jgi:hypothetical protein
MAACPGKCFPAATPEIALPKLRIPKAIRFASALPGSIAETLRLQNLIDGPNAKMVFGIRPVSQRADRTGGLPYPECPDWIVKPCPQLI